MKYENPIIKGFNPDPSICRVGGDYYIVTSSFEHFPAIPIYHSTDLVNWEQIGNCITRRTQLDFSKFKSSGGVWAPTIRFNDGRFYVTATVDGVGNMIIHTDDIYGEWSDPIWVDMGGIDPSLYFEDGRAFYCTNVQVENVKESVSLAEIDIETGKLKENYRPIWQGTGGGWLEGQHIYRIGEYYYILTAEGGTSFNHMETTGRSKNIYGPYESSPHNPILTNRNDTTKQIHCAGHADLFDDEQGNLYMVHLGVRPALNNKSPLGRETFLTPVKIVDGWIRVDGGKATIVNELPHDAVQRIPKPFVCDFADEKWEPRFLRDNGTFVRGGGTLKMAANDSPAFLGIRQPDFEFEAQMTCSFDADGIGDEAGMMMYLSENFNYRICKTRKSDGDYVCVIRTADDMKEISFEEKIPSGEITFKITGDRKQYHFYYAVNGGALRSAGAYSVRFLCTETEDRCFTGTLTGMYVFGNSAAQITEFRLK